MRLQLRIKRALLRASTRLPRRLKRRLAGTPPLNDRGVPLDPDIHWLLLLKNLEDVAFASGSVEDARREMRVGVALVEAPHVDITVRDEQIEGIPCRRYVPRDPTGARLVYAHGGGWVVGDLQSHEGLCRRLAANSGVELIAVDYRLAPEHPYPAGLHDVCAVFASEANRPGLVAVGGDSAGGNLSAALCQRQRDLDGPLPDLQLLIYPGVDQTKRYPSRDQFSEGFVLGDTEIDWFKSRYTQPSQRSEPYVSPLLGTLEGLPRAVVFSAGFDPLRDETEAYAHALQAAGVDVELVPLNDQVHGFLAMDGVSAGADRAIQRIERALHAWARSESEGSTS